jgi:hypothetical protein
MCAFLLFAASCGKKEAKSAKVLPTDQIAEPKRARASKAPEVVLITYSRSLRCTGTILGHGVVLTARHCFDNGIPKELGQIEIQIEDEVSSTKLTITDILSLNFDSGENDIAWLTYPPEQSLAIQSISKVPLNRTSVPKEGDQLTLIGYPQNDTGSLIKLETAPCLRLNREGKILPLPSDPGYIGTLYGTNCIAWRGNSGGPLFSMKKTDSGLVRDQLIGIVTHTFDLTAEGSILSSALGKDQFGTYVKTVNFSSLKDAKDVDLYLK